MTAATPDSTGHMTCDEANEAAYRSHQRGDDRTAQAIMAAHLVEHDDEDSL